MINSLPYSPLTRISPTFFQSLFEERSVPVFIQSIPNAREAELRKPVSFAIHAPATDSPLGSDTSGRGVSEIRRPGPRRTNTAATA